MIEFHPLNSRRFLLSRFTAQLYVSMPRDPESTFHTSVTVKQEETQNTADDGIWSKTQTAVSVEGMNIRCFSSGSFFKLISLTKGTSETLSAHQSEGPDPKRRLSIPFTNAARPRKSFERIKLNGVWNLDTAKQEWMTNLHITITNQRFHMHPALLPDLTDIPNCTSMPGHVTSSSD